MYNLEFKKIAPKCILCVLIIVPLLPTLSHLLPNLIEPWVLPNKSHSYFHVVSLFVLWIRMCGCVTHVVYLIFIA